MWVINNGVAHGDSVRGADIMPWVDEALDSLEFITGAPDTKWGSVRVAMGHPEPWAINYMAIGNEVGRWVCRAGSWLPEMHPCSNLASCSDLPNPKPLGLPPLFPPFLPATLPGLRQVDVLK